MFIALCLLIRILVLQWTCLDTLIINSHFGTSVDMSGHTKNVNYNSFQASLSDEDQYIVAPVGKRM